MIAELRRLGVQLAKERGLELAAAGTHPFSRPKDQEIVDEPRYTEFVDYAGISARRQGVSGLHVHVGMPSAEACFHALEATLPWLPVILAMSANSPFLAGEETGLASNRAEVLAQLPRSGALPAFRSYEEWEAFVDRFVRLGIAADYTRFWWDVRPHPKFGTLEVRMPDQPTSLAVTAAFTALVQALCVTVLEGEPPAVRPADARPLPAEPVGSASLRPRGGALPPERRAGRQGVGARGRADRARDARPPSGSDPPSCWQGSI